MAELFDTLGLAYDFNNQHTEAQEAFGKAVALNPQNNLFRNNLATSYLRAGNQSAGIAEFQTVLKADPSNRTAGLNLGSFYLSQKQYQLAIRYFQAAGVERSPDPASLLEYTEAQFGAGEVQSARDTAVRLSRLARVDAGIHFSLGLLLAQHGEYRMAAEQFAAIPPSQRDTAADLNLGMVYSRQRQFQEARQAYQDAIRLDPSNPDPYLQMGLDASALGNHDAAIDWITQAHTKSPQRIDIVYVLAEELIHVGNLERARDLLLAVRERDPNEPALWEALGDLYSRQHRGQDAQQAYQQCLRLSPQRVRARVLLARADVELHQPEEARKELERALQLEPHNSEANAELGRMEFEAGQTEAAMRYIAQALATDPDNLRANEDLARIELHQGKPAEALPVLQRLVKLNPQNSQFHYLLGQALAKLQRAKEAQAEFELSSKLKAGRNDDQSIEPFSSAPPPR
jgi:tetratricopeptide (TPR) repeat protein